VDGAGRGTDFYPRGSAARSTRTSSTSAAIAALRGIADRARRLAAGATTTWSELLETPLPPLFDGR
jgi:hypothetical protein